MESIKVKPICMPFSHCLFFWTFLAMHWAYGQVIAAMVHFRGLRLAGQKSDSIIIYIWPVQAVIPKPGGGGGGGKFWRKKKKKKNLKKQKKTKSK